MIAPSHRRALLGAVLCCTPLMVALAQAGTAAGVASSQPIPSTAVASPEFQPTVPGGGCLTFTQLSAPSAAPLLAVNWTDPALLAATSLPPPGSRGRAPVNPLQRLHSTGPVQVTEPITTSSDQLTALPNGLIRLSGNVDVHMGDREVQGQQMTFNRLNDDITVSGMVRFTDPTVQIDGDSGHYSTTGAQFQNAQFHFLTHPGRGRAASMSMTPAHVVTLQRIFYTSCPANRTDWDIRARQMVLDTPASRGIARGAVVDFKGIPIIYIPYLSFPLSASRQSGVLFPLFGTSTRDGITLGIPVYWNIAPNQDATFTPTEYSSRGTDMGVEYRFLSSNDSGTFDGDYLPYDSQLHTERSYLKLINQLNLPDNTRLQADLESVSDDEYFEDFTQGVQSTATAFLPRTLSLVHRDDVWTVGVQSLGFQTLDNTLPIDARPYEEAPRLNASANWSPALFPWLRTGFDSEVTNFSRTSCYSAYCYCSLMYCLTQGGGSLGDFPDGADVSGWRMDLEPHIGADISAPGYFLRPTLSWELTQYELRNATAGSIDNTSMTAFDAGYFPIAAQGPYGAYGPFGPAGPGAPYGVPYAPYPPTGMRDVYSPALAYAPYAGIDPYAFAAAGAAGGGAVDSAPYRSLPIITVDSGLTFDRLTGANGSQTVTLEPRVMYVYIPYRDQNDLPLFDTGLPDPNLIELFRANRYVGLDRIGDANEFTLGLTSELFSTATGTRYITATIGQSLYLSDPRVTLPGEDINPQRSDLIGEVNVAAYHDWNMLLDIASNATVTRIEETEGELQYRRNGTEVLNFGYQYYQGLFQQVDTSAAWPVLSHWDLYGRLVYSIMGGSAIEEFAGFQYRGACWGIRAVWQSSLATRYGGRDTGVSVQLELTGLSSVGSQVDTFLEQQIRGYSTTPNGRVMNTPFSP